MALGRKYAHGVQTGAKRAGWHGDFRSAASAAQEQGLGWWQPQSVAAESGPARNEDPS